MYKLFFAHSDPKLTSLYQSRLSPSFSFDSATNGLIALRKIRNILPDVIVSDYKLPLVSGLGLLRFVRSHQDLQGIPFLFISDYRGVDKALGLGANEWIRRNSHPDEVLEKIYYHIKINRNK